jgi:hypothetical protein
MLGYEQAEDDERRRETVVETSLGVQTQPGLAVDLAARLRQPDVTREYGIGGREDRAQEESPAEREAHRPDSEGGDRDNREWHHDEQQRRDRNARAAAHAALDRKSS